MKSCTDSRLPKIASTVKLDHTTGWLLTGLPDCTPQRAAVMAKLGEKSIDLFFVCVSATVVLLCLFRYHRLLRKLSKKQRLKMNGGDYHAPKHIFGQPARR